MKTYDAFEIFDENSEKTVAIVWWDGGHIRSTDATILSRLKKMDISVGTMKKPYLTFGDGEDFFKALPHAFRSGYIHLKHIKVDESGKQI